jgi:cation/acetate symporter
MADVLSFRLKQKPVRLAAATSTLTVSLFYLLAQMAGAGGLVALLLDIKSRTGQSVVIAVVGVLMIVYVLIGGMRGTTWVQIIKAVLLISGAAIMTVMVLGKFGLDFSNILGSAQSRDLRVGQRGRRQPRCARARRSVRRIDDVQGQSALASSQRSRSRRSWRS